MIYYIYYSLDLNLGTKVKQKSKYRNSANKKDVLKTRTSFVFALKKGANLTQPFLLEQFLQLAFPLR